MAGGRDVLHAPAAVREPPTNSPTSRHVSYSSRPLSVWQAVTQALQPEQRSRSTSKAYCCPGPGGVQATRPIALGSEPTLAALASCGERFDGRQLRCSASRSIKHASPPSCTAGSGEMSLAGRLRTEQCSIECMANCLVRTVRHGKSSRRNPLLEEPELARRWQPVPTRMHAVARLAADFRGQQLVEHLGRRQLQIDAVVLRPSPGTCGCRYSSPCSDSPLSSENVFLCSGQATFGSPAASPTMPRDKHKRLFVRAHVLAWHTTRRGWRN